MGDVGASVLARSEERAEGVQVGAVRVGGSEYRVRIIEGDREPMVDVREYVLPERAEATRAYVPKGKGRGKVRASFEGYTRRGLRFDLETWSSVLALVAGAMAEAENAENAGAES